MDKLDEIRVWLNRPGPATQPHTELSQAKIFLWELLDLAAAQKRRLDAAVAVIMEEENFFFVPHPDDVQANQRLQEKWTAWERSKEEHDA